MFQPREGQSEILKYPGGKLGITAVPGSGKTHTLSYLAAKLIVDDRISEDQEILIVTLVNSAVNNFASRIADFLKGFGLIPGIGYRVRTLHGLAYDIVREQPQLAGMDNLFSIADERSSDDILSITATNWIRTHPEILLDLSAEGIDPSSQKRNWNDLIQSIAQNGISLCKDLLLSPHDLLNHSDLMQDPLFAMVQQIYTDYERALQDRGAVDFSDLIRLAYIILQNNPGYLDLLQNRWPFILEDEAQDSSAIQEKLLALLSAKSNNWVRVGDPNQAIFETFTTADPRLLRRFVDREDVTRVDLPRSGRSSASIIRLANHLISWTKAEHPKIEMRRALDEPLIKPTRPDDPQPNPPDDLSRITLFAEEMTPEREIKLIARSAGQWLKENPDKTLAILIPRNARGAEMVDALTNLYIPVIELLSTSKTTRETASILSDIFTFLAKPLIRRNLEKAFSAVAGQSLDDNEVSKLKMANIVDHLRLLKNPEILFTNPGGMEDFIRNREIGGEEAVLLIEVFTKLQLWQHALLLPVDEMTVSIGSDLFKDPADLALTHKIALLLKQAHDYYPDWNLGDFALELSAIAGNRYRLYGFSEDNFGFDPDRYQGYAVVSTMHKAKGLEWDRVYLLSVNNYNFPSLAEHDTYFSEKWFVKDQRNLEAEALQKIRWASGEEINTSKNSIDATHQARTEFCAERLRLLFVGITRARQELIITWNNGRRGNSVEALPLTSLREYWDMNLGK